MLAAAQRTGSAPTQPNMNFSIHVDRALKLLVNTYDQGGEQTNREVMDIENEVSSLKRLAAQSALRLSLPSFSPIGDLLVRITHRPRLSPQPLAATQTLRDLAAAKLPSPYRTLYACCTEGDKVGAVHRLASFLEPRKDDFPIYARLALETLVSSRHYDGDIVESARELYSSRAIHIIAHRAPTQYPLQYEPLILYISYAVITEHGLEFTLRCLKKSNFYIDIKILQGYDIRLIKYRHPENDAKLRFKLYVEERHVRAEEEVLFFRICVAVNATASLSRCKSISMLLF